MATRAVSKDSGQQEKAGRFSMVLINMGHTASEIDTLPEDEWTKVRRIAEYIWGIKEYTSPSPDTKDMIKSLMVGYEDIKDSFGLMRAAGLGVKL